MKVIVTGASGFIGSAVAKRLLAAGDEVVGLDVVRRETRLIPNGVRWICGDIRDARTLGAALAGERASALVHLAYDRDIAKLERDPISAVGVNVEAFMALLDRCGSSGVPRMVWASSIAVYGPANAYKPSHRVEERDGCQPDHMYGVFKVFDELCSSWFSRKNGITSVALRPSIVYGPGRWFSGYNNYSVQMFARAVRGERYVVDRPSQLVNWLYIDDLAEAFYLAVHKENVKSGAYNVVGDEVSLLGAAEAVKLICPRFTFNVCEGGDDDRCPVAHLSGRAAEIAFGYKPRYTFERGSKKYIEMLRSGLAKLPQA